MRLEDITLGQTKQYDSNQQQQEQDPSPNLTSYHPEVNELLSRSQGGQDIGCRWLNDSDHAFITAVFSEVLLNPWYAPSAPMLDLIRVINLKLSWPP